VRQRLRRDHGFPRDDGKSRAAFGVTAIYSDEPVRRPSPECVAPDSELVAGLSCSGYGSSVTVTATMGLVAAAVALTQLAAGGHRGA
jgi:tRNA threonylcarbamoyladenosine dehydratase